MNPEREVRVMGRAKSRTVSVKDVLVGYKPPPDLSVPAVIAHLCDYMAKRMPKQPIPWNWVAKICNGRPTLPREDGKEVEQMKSRLSRAREICMDEYSRYIVHMPGFGIWATTNADDAARYGAVRADGRLLSAGRRALEVRGIINPGEIKDDKLRNYVTDTSGALKTLQTKVLPALEAKKDEGKE